MATKFSIAFTFFLCASCALMPLIEARLLQEPAAATALQQAEHDAAPRLSTLSLVSYA
jgi:hypothetical protein